MATGIVKRWVSEKGFGFIKPDGGGKDLFVHFSNIVGIDGRVDLEEGQAVNYELGEGKKGPMAVEVQVIAE